MIGMCVVKEGSDKDLCTSLTSDMYTSLWKWPLRAEVNVPVNLEQSK